jgi:hypothetical protein
LQLCSNHLCLPRILLIQVLFVLHQTLQVFFNLKQIHLRECLLEDIL